MTTNGTDYDQNQQTLQFYKIKLMEKQREISDHAAKLKKIQFKNNRDIKELKMAEEKAKNQLKQQKQKIDKINKMLTEATQQNNVLQHRLNELKEEKDKQIQTTRAQYNHLKTQVRSYERILPTHTFMTKFNFNYQKLPTYQDIFMNLKERSDRFDELQEKFKKYKAQTEEKIDMQFKVNQSLQKKKAEVEKQLREDIHKLLDLQSQLTTVASERDQLRNSVNDLSQQIRTETHLNQQLTEQIKVFEGKIQEICTACAVELESKDEQHRRIMQEESTKHQDQVQRITRDYQMRQNSHLQQLAYFEEEEHRLMEQKQKDKERFEQYQREMHLEVERIRAELDTQKQEIWRISSQYEKLKQQLRIKNNQCLSYLQKLGEYEIKTEQLSNQVRKLQDKLASSKDESNQKYGSVLEEKNELLIKIKQLEEELDESRQECLSKQNQVRILLNELEDLKHKGTTMSKGNSEYLSNGMDFEQSSSIRNRSNTQENGVIEKIATRQNLNLPPTIQLRHREDSQISNRSDRRKSGVFYSQQQFQIKLAENLREKEKQFQVKMEKSILEAKTITQSQLKENFNQEMNQILKEHKKQVNELKKKEEDVQNKLKKIYEQHEMEKFQLNESINKLTKKYDLLKLEKEGLEQNYIEHLNQAKRDKQGLNSFKTQNRQLEKSIKDYVKNIEGLNNQLELLKKYKERIEARENKEKSVSSESSTSNIKDVIEKYTAQITRLVHEKEEEIKLKETYEDELNNIKRQIVVKNNEIDSLKVQLEEKNREIKMLDGLLDHERKDRTLRTVPSLASLPDQDEQQQQNFKEFYNQAGQKQGQILILEREVNDLKIEIQEIKQKYEHKIMGLEEQMNGYIQQIIEMKLKVANAEMKASEKTYLYNQLKKKLNIK